MPNQLHDDVLNFLETYRTKHPDFVYWLRQRNTNNRLNDGFWFQGNQDYAFVGLYDRGGGSNMTRSMGIVFEMIEGKIICYFEVVFNEESDEKIIQLYKGVMDLIGGFKRISDTRFRKMLYEDNVYAAAETFLNNTKPQIDALIIKSGLSSLFIDKSKFDNWMKNTFRMKAETKRGLFPENKIDELKARFSGFKSEDFYKYRIQQLQFIPFAKKVIEESLSITPLTNEIFTNLIQCLKNGALEKTVELCLDKNIVNVSERAALIQQYKKLKLTGFTGAGKMSIYGLSTSQLSDVKNFLLNCARINNIEDAITAVKNYENKKTPQVTKGVYSPWLYYLNSKIFPIHNNSHTDFIKWCEQPPDSYTLVIQLFHEIADILDERELGVIDAFAHRFTPGKKPESLKKENHTMSLNTIFYGPPGTGKTYNTINKAVAIANPEFDQATCSRDELQKEYNRLYKDGQIEFITFHQGLSYEDFIEGIKPMEPREGDEFLKYEIKEGIFKRLCEKAAKIPEAKPEKFSISNDSFEKAGFYKISLGDTSNPDDDQIYEWCIANGYIALGWGDAIDFNGKTENDIQQMVPEQLERFAAQSVNYFIHYLKPGDYVVVTFGNLQFRAIGKVTGSYEFKNVDGLSVHQFRKVEWLVKNVELPYEEVYNKQFSQQSIYRLNKREIKRDFFVKSAGQKSDDTKIKNYVLIIDEINRGNVSQIFGELITLIEVNKRAGNEEALSVQLPYSKKQFSVPNNLYIIGTMNTADRSVEALDWKTHVN